MYPEELALNEDESAVPRGSALERVDSEADLDFDELFQRYSSMVFRLAYHILGDREEALDVSQEVFLTIYRKLNTFRGESSLKTWIYCIAANRASNRASYRYCRAGWATGSGCGEPIQSRFCWRYF